MSEFQWAMLIVGIAALLGGQIAMMVSGKDFSKRVRILTRRVKQNDKALEELYAKLSSLDSRVEELQVPPAVPIREKAPTKAKTFTEFRKLAEGE